MGTWLTGCEWFDSQIAMACFEIPFDLLDRGFNVADFIMMNLEGLA